MTNTEVFLIEINSCMFRVDSNHIKCADPENFSQRWRGGGGVLKVFIAIKLFHRGPYGLP